jgi:hypothetical protein
MKYYTYAHYTADTKELFYVGKGTVHKQSKFHRARAKVGRNPYWQNKVNKHGGFEVQILSLWETEQEAFEHEKLLIQCFDKLTNLTTGGEGNSGRVQSEQEKIKRANAIRGQKRTQETLQRMSEAQKVNTKAKEILDAQRELTKKKVLCVETGVLYNSLTEAGRFAKIPFQNISKVCLGKRPKAGGYTWKYTEA